MNNEVSGKENVQPAAIFSEKRSRPILNMNFKFYIYLPTVE